MVHKNYKWNLSKNEGSTLIYNLIIEILKERTDNCIEIDELLLLINSRTKEIKITNNNKQKTLTNFIKNVFGGLNLFLDTLEDINKYERNDTIYIKLNCEKEWIFVENYE